MREGSDNRRKKLGAWGEDLACQYLRENGVNVIEKNVYTPYGEIDVVGEINQSIIFIEVKTRKTSSYGYPEVSINRKKAEHMVNSAMSYMQNRNSPSLPWRIDVIAILVDENKPAKIKWFQNAISG